jgi:endoglucanase
MASLLALMALAHLATAAVPTTAFGIIDDMGPGWNLGNTLDGTGGETGWGNPVTTQKMIDTVHAAGYKTLRVPVRWDENLSGSGHTIATAWMDRVEQIVNYGLNDGMYVIVNIHHNNGWEDPTTANEANAKDYLTKIWAQIAARFQKYDNHVIFETMNEPTVTTNGVTDWTGTTEYYGVVNRLNAAALSTIRATGGNNATRLVMIPGYGANSDSRSQYTVVPSDAMVAVSVHCYAPLDFALNYPGVSTFTDTASVDYSFNTVSSLFVKKGIPAVMGEWASLNKNNLSERVKYAAYFAKRSKATRIPIVLWDNGVTTAGSSGMGYLKRSVPTWAFPTINQAIMDVLRTTSIQSPAVAHNVPSIEITRSSEGIRFASTKAFDRYTLTDLFGRTRELPGGTGGFLPANTLHAGVYLLRARSGEHQTVERIVVDR